MIWIIFSPRYSVFLIKYLCFHFTYFAQFTQYRLSGLISIRPNGIGLWHFKQSPKSLSSILDNTCCRFLNFSSDCRRAASVMLLLLMASILEIRPMATSGATGFVNSWYSLTNNSVSEILSRSICFNSLLSIYVSLFLSIGKRILFIVRSGKSLKIRIYMLAINHKKQLPKGSFYFLFMNHFIQEKSFLGEIGVLAITIFSSQLL